MAARLANVHDQALNHFVTDSPWDPAPVRRRLAHKMDAAIDPEAWVLDDTGYLKSGDASVCVARQYTGTAGKVTNCQVGVSLHLASDVASCPVNWQLFVPERWDPDSPKATNDVATRRAKAGIPDGIGHREKWRLGLGMVDEMIGWGLRPPLLVADAGYGDAGEFRQSLEDRDIPYVVQVALTATAYPQAIQRSAPPYSGVGRRPPRNYPENAPSIKDPALAVGPDAVREVTWRQGSRRRGGTSVPMRSHFLFLRVRPAAQAHRQANRERDLPVQWLIVEWPPDQSEPTRYWFSDLPSTTPESILVRLAKLRWRIEHDYRELKHGLGLDHYEGRTWAGWHPRLRRPRIPHPATPRPKSPCAGLSLHAVLRVLQTILIRLVGACPTCQTRFPTGKPRDRLRS